MIEVIIYFIHLDYYEIFNGTANENLYKSNSSTLEKLKKIGMEKDELFQEAKINSLKAR